jgi:hypothetical protein
MVDINDVPRLTAMLEGKDGKKDNCGGFINELAGQDPEFLFDAMKKQNQIDRKENPNLPELYFSNKQTGDLNKVTIGSDADHGKILFVGTYKDGKAAPEVAGWPAIVCDPLKF